MPGFEVSENQDDSEEAVTVPEHQRKNKSKKGEYIIDIPDDLPREVRVIDVPDEKKICPESGDTLIEIDRDVTEKLAYKPGSYYVLRIERPKYAIKRAILYSESFSSQLLKLS